MRRGRSDVAILMLTAKAGEQQRVAGVGLGAEDYLAKPFSSLELVARVKAVLRRMRDADMPLVEPLDQFARERLCAAATHSAELAGSSYRHDGRWTPDTATQVLPLG